MNKHQGKVIRVVAIASGVAWSVLLHISGIDLSSNTRRAVAYIPTAVALLGVVFDIWAWKLPLIQRLTGRPLISGTWRTTLKPHAKSRIPKGGNWGPITGAIVIEQTFWTLSVKLLTAESSSRSELATLRSTGDSRVEQQLTYTYRNEPKQEHRPRSQVHRGASELWVVGLKPKAISGTYWTDRLTAGDMELVFVDRSTDRARLSDVPPSSQR